MLIQSEKNTIQTLAKKYMEIANLPVQQEKIRLWKALNTGNMQRPMVAIDQPPWHELNNDGSLSPTIEDPFWRDLELWLKRTLFRWQNFPADMVVEPFIPIPMAIENFDYGIEIQEECSITDIHSDIVGHYYINQLQTEDDIQKICDMKINHNEKETNSRYDIVSELLFDIVPVRLYGVQIPLCVWDRISQWMGVEDSYINLIERPEFLHAVLRRLTDATLVAIEEANKQQVYGDIVNTCHCSYVYTTDLLPQPGQGKGPITQNSWAFAMAQLFTSVSPEMTEEFELPYVKELAEHFGSIYYGCCERLDDRLDIVKKIPNLRKISCCPWSSRETFAELIGPNLVMSVKPSPSLVACSPVDYSEIERDLKQTIKVAQKNNANIEIILKDISTVGYNPQTLTEWNNIAMKLAGA